VKRGIIMIIINILKDLLIILWKVIPKYSKIATMMIFIFLIFAFSTLDHEGRVAMGIFIIGMFPFYLLLLILSIIEPNKKIKE
jgi:hypothetical protein